MDLTEISYIYSDNIIIQNSFGLDNDAVKIWYRKYKKRGIQGHTQHNACTQMCKFMYYMHIPVSIFSDQQLLTKLCAFVMPQSVIQLSVLEVT